MTETGQGVVVVVVTRCPATEVERQTPAKTKRKKIVLRTVALDVKYCPNTGKNLSKRHNGVIMGHANSKSHSVVRSVSSLPSFSLNPHLLNDVADQMSTTP